MLIMGVAPILAPLIGGYGALFFGWRTMFGIASSLVSYFNNGTALAMTALVGACGIAAFLALNLLLGDKKRRDFSVSEDHITFG